MFNPANDIQAQQAKAAREQAERARREQADKRHWDAVTAKFEPALKAALAACETKARAACDPYGDHFATATVDGVTAGAEIRGYEVEVWVKSWPGQRAGQFGPGYMSFHGAPFERVPPANYWDDPSADTDTPIDAECAVKPSESIGAVIFAHCTHEDLDAYEEGWD